MRGPVISLPRTWRPTPSQVLAKAVQNSGMSYIGSISHMFSGPPKIMSKYRPEKRPSLSTLAAIVCMSASIRARQAWSPPRSHSVVQLSA